MRKKLIVLLTILVMMAFGTNAYAAGIYDDVSPDNWAYKAVKELAAQGIIEGYNGSVFAGNKTASRHEVAQMVFNSLQNYEKATIEQKALIDALKTEYNDIFTKVLDHEKRIKKLETTQSKVTYSGTLTTRYKDTDYMQLDRGSVAATLYRLRLEVKAAIDDNSFLGLRYVTRAPNMKDLWNDPFINFGQDNNTDTNPQHEMFDRIYYDTKIGNGADFILGRQALVIDPMNMLVDSTFYSYDGGKLNYVLKKADNTSIAIQYGRFYKGAAMIGFTGWGNKSAADFISADIASVIISHRNENSEYTVGYADFRNNIIGKELLTYTFANIGFRVAPKVGISFEAANNSADANGRVMAAKLTYGDQSLKKNGQWNLSYRYIDAQENGIFNRFAQLEGAAGRNTNHPQKLGDLQLNYAISANTTFLLQRLAIDDTAAANDVNDSVIWKGELNVKF